MKPTPFWFCLGYWSNDTSFRSTMQDVFHCY
jgi:hypothetical protein